MSVLQTFQDLTPIHARLKSCDLCPRRCGCDRTHGETGFCGSSIKPKIYQHFLHMGEEYSIIPAFIINMSGCSLACPTCPEWCRFHQPPLPVGDAQTYAQKLAKHFETIRPKTLEWVGGEPSTQLLFVLETSQKLKTILKNCCPTIILNTNAYFDVDLLDAMKGAIDAFIFDLKCTQNCHAIVGHQADYWKTATHVIQSAVSAFPQKHILRHLVMPGHVTCCTKPILTWCLEHIPDVTFNLMTTFHDFRAEIPISLPKTDAKEALDVFKDSELPHKMLNGQALC